MPWFDKEGNTIGLFGISRDITERKQTEGALRESEEKFRNLAELSPNMIFINQDGKVVYVNNKCVEIIGYRKEEFYSPDFDFLPLVAPEYRDLVKKTHVEHMKGKETTPIEYPLITKAGKRIEVLHTSALITYRGETAILGTDIDITERKRAEAAYRALVDHSLQGLEIFQDGRAVFANQAMAEITGYTVDEILAMSPQQIQDFVHPEDRALVWGRHRDRLKGKRLPDRYEFRGIRKDGTICWLEIHASRIEYQGKPAIQAAYVDVTDRKRAEGALKESEQRYRTIFESMTDSLFILDVKGDKLVGVNPAACKMYGYTHDEFLELTPSTLVHPDCAHLFGEFLETTKADGTFHTTSVDLRKDRTPIDVQVDGRMISYQGKAHLLVVVRDITDRKKAGQKLLEDQAKLKSLTSQLTLAEERERRRIATELHDRIGQSLVVSKMNLEALRKSEYGKKTDETLDEICNSLGQTIADTRTLTFDLSSPILYQLGFETAVAEWLTEQIQDNHGIEAEFEDDGRPKPLDDDIRILLFRNVRELLINVVRHARADKVKVSIRKFDEQICVSVEDDGVGFDPAEAASAAAKRAEFGLFSIRQRLEELGGHLEIESEPGCGCKVTMTAPLKQE